MDFTIDEFNKICNPEGDKILMEKLFIHLYGEDFSTISFSIPTNTINNIKKTYEYTKIYKNDYYSFDDSPNVMGSYYRLIFDGFLLECYLDEFNGSGLLFTTIHYKNDKQNIIDSIIKKAKKDFEKWQLLPMNQKTNLNVVTLRNGQLKLNEVTGKQFIFEEDNYNDDICDKKDELINLLQTNTNGIYYLHGDPGSGKTTLIKSIANQIDKKFIFFPPNMSTTLSSPDFLPFLMEHKKSIIVIEDAENAIQNRGSGNDTAVSNLLNVSDGILSDLLSIQIICTFNTEIVNIDKALLRKGRAKKIIEINKLSVEKTNNLLRKLGHDYISNEEMMLTDIYNFEQEAVMKTKTRIGFNK